MADIPLAYAPPFGSAKDPINILGFIAENLMDGLAHTVQWRELATDTRMLVDVRDKTESDAGAIPGAINIPLPELRDHLRELEARQVIVYCHVGMRGHTATHVARRRGRRRRQPRRRPPPWMSATTP